MLPASFTRKVPPASPVLLALDAEEPTDEATEEATDDATEEATEEATLDCCELDWLPPTMP